MKKVIVVSIFFSFLFVGLTSQASAQKAKVYKKGQVVALVDVIDNVKDKQLTKSKAKELVEAGSPLVFLYNKKVYFVINEDGSFAFRQLVNYAANSKVEITGIMKTINGINYIIMTNIASND